MSVDTLCGTESVLLYAVVAYPDEDTPRLEYADWLDENALPGDGRSEWAEFIRRSVEENLSLPMRRRTPKDRVAAWKRVAWDPNPVGEPGEIQFARWRNGFLEEVEVWFPERLFRPGLFEDLFRRHPIRRVDLLGGSPGVGVYIDGSVNWRMEQWWTRPGDGTDPAISARRREVWSRIDLRMVTSPLEAEVAMLPVMEVHARLADRWRTAMSDAVVKYGRQLAGLPTLPAPE